MTLSLPVSGWNGVLPPPAVDYTFTFTLLHISCSLIISRTQSVACAGLHIRGTRVDKISLQSYCITVLL